MAGDAERLSKKRKAAQDSSEEAARREGGAEEAAEAGQGPKRPREAADQASSACNQDGPPDRASAEPAAHLSSDKGVEPPAEEGAQEPYGDLGLEDADLSAAAAAAKAAAAAAEALLGRAGSEGEDGLPMAIDGSDVADKLEAMAAALIAEARAKVRAQQGPGAAAPGGAPPAAAAVGAASKQEAAASALLPQCAVMTGTALDAGEVSTCQLEPLPAREPGAQYLAVREELRAALVPPGQAGVSWELFPDHLGEGARARLLALATLHLGAGGAGAGGAPAFPAAVKELPANSNRVLLGAANSCELYQERVIRALAQKVQAPLLVADVYNLKLDEVLKDEPSAAPGSLLDEMYGGGGGGPGFPPDPWDLSDEDDPFLGVPKFERKGDGLGRESSLDTVLAMRPKKPGAPRGASGMGAFFSLGAPGGRPGSGLAGAAAAAAAAATAAAERAAAAAKAAREKAEAANERAAAAKAAARPATTALDAAAAVAPAEDAGAAAPAEAAQRPAYAPPATDVAQQQEGGSGSGSASPMAAQDAAQQQPAASAVASVPPPGEPFRQAAKPAHGKQLDGLNLPAASAAVGSMPAAAHDVTRAAAGGASAAASKPAGLALRRGDRVTYAGRVHPSLAAAQQRLDQLHAAIQRVESSGNQRARDYLPQLLVRRQVMAAQSQRVPRLQASGAPPVGSKGRVTAVQGDKVQVQFDEPFAGSASLAGQQEKCGFTCAPDELQVVEDKEDPVVSSLQALFDVVVEEAETGPIIVFIQNLDRLLRTHATDHFRKLEALLATLPPRCLLFGGYCSRSLARADAKRDSGPPGLSRLFGSLGGDAGLGGLGDELPLLDRFRGPGRGGQRKSTKGKLLSKMLPNHLELHPPNQDVHAKSWKKMVENDVATMRQRSNRTALRKAVTRCGCVCDDWEAVSISDCQLARKEIEQVVGMAVAEQLAAQEAGEAAPEPATPAAEAAPASKGGNAEAAASAEQQPAAAQAGGQQPTAGEQQPMQTDEAEAAADGTIAGPAATTAAGGAAAAAAEAVTAPPAPLWTLRAAHVMAAADAVRKVAAEAAAQPDKQGLKDVAVDQYEKQLLSEVIPPEEINVSFDDIGALDAVKDTLHEVVILPLQRPELFTRGSLTKPTKGLLLFGPPGTGKTMLAKAVASESGAHFINVNMSAITSKWFGEGERLVRALFGLAHKLAPSVIFVDEIDSFLSKRGQSNNEHEALRKMKNEFVTHWDGLRTKQADRVLVLAATNRPMDLDDAVIRRMPRRIFVPLPDATNRERILQVLLKDEALDPAFDFKEAAALADGYSGSDLKNLCIAAAYCPIREFLEKERAAMRAAAAAKKEAAAAGGAAAAQPVAAAPVQPAGPRPAALAAVAAPAPVTEPVVLRRIAMDDFKEALKQVTASTHSDSATMGELERWNDQYGEGGSRRKEQLAYYT